MLSLVASRERSERRMAAGIGPRGIEKCRQSRLWTARSVDAGSRSARLL